MSGSTPPSADTPAHPSDPHPQIYHSAVTVESLDVDGLGVIDPETSEELLYSLDPTHDHTHGASSSTTTPPVLDRDDSIAYAARREHSRIRKPWWKRPSPYWLLLIQLGGAISMGMGVAPKAEIYNQLACMVHYPYTSDAPPSQPIQSNPSIPSAPIQIPSQPDSAANASHVLFRSFNDVTEGRKMGLDLEGQEGMLIDPVLCRKSPEVQAAVARFTTAMTIVQGILAALTTGWWGRISDKWGRTKVLAIAMLGIISNDIVFLVVAQYSAYVPGGYTFLLVGPIIDGLLGGYATLGATNQAYIADSTPDGTRAQIFSRLAGIMMLGFAIGPVVGSLVIRQSSSVVSVFYIAFAIHVLAFLLVLFVLPESLSLGARDALAKIATEHARERSDRDEAERRWEEESVEEPVESSTWSRLSGVTSERRLRKSRGALNRFFRRAFGFLSPLTIFWPSVDENEPKGRKNWNLTFLAIGNAMLMLMMGVMSVKFQYTQFAFGWGPAELGPALSVIGSVRAVHLLLILPLLVRCFKPKASQKSPSAKTSDSHFDHTLIRLSLVLDIVAYAGIVFISSPSSFILSTLLSTFGAGAGPAVNSLGLALLPSSRIAGRLFGAMSVLQAVMSTVLSPLLFGYTYAYTVKINMPKTVFVLALVMLIIALAAFSMIRLEKPEPSVEEATEQTPLLTDEAIDRGRGRTFKQVAGGSGFSLRTEETSSA